MSTGPPSVVVMGDIMMDIAIKPAGPVRVASDTPSTVRLSVGGTGANTAIHLARLGVPTLLLGRFGDDDLGHLVRGRLRREGVGIPDKPVEGCATGAIGVFVDGHGQRTMFPHRGANDRLSLAYVREHWPPEQPRALFVSGYVLFQPSTREAALWGMTKAAEANIPVVVDPASYALIDDVGAHNFLRWIGSATVLLPNRQEAAVLAAALSDSVRPGDDQEAVRVLASRFAAVVATFDADGAFLGAGSDEGPVATEKVSVVDTTGAGDAFNAGFLAAYIAGAPLRDAARAGNRLAAQVVQQIGPT